MSRTLCALTALMALLIAGLPASAMTSTDSPSFTLKDGTLRYNDPKGSWLNNFSLSAGVTSGTYGSSYGSGYAYGSSFGSNSSQSNGSSSNNPFISGYVPSTNPGFSPTVPSGARLTDPTFGPNGLYTQGLRTTNP